MLASRITDVPHNYFSTFIGAAVALFMSRGEAIGQDFAAAQSTAGIDCYRAAGPDRSLRKFCESARIVTLEPLNTGDPINVPSAAIVALHQSRGAGIRFDPIVAPSSSIAQGVNWEGLAIGAGWGRVPEGGRPLVDLNLTARWLVPRTPWLAGLEIGREAGIGSRRRGATLLDSTVSRLSFKAGYALSERWLVHAGGGVAVGEGHGRTPALGWTAGAGIAYALDKSWSLTLDYRFTRMTARIRDERVSLGQRVDRDRSSILGGVTYHFLGL